MFKFGRADLTNAHRGDWTSLNFAYAVTTEVRVKKQKATFIEWSNAEHNTVNSEKGFVLPSS